MTVDSLIDELLEEGKTQTFANNSVQHSYEKFGRISTDFHAWTVKVEDLVDTYYGKESAPGRLIASLNLKRIDGNYESEFTKQQNIILGTLTACKAIKSKKAGSVVDPAKTFNTNKVFIVHGHDDLAKIQVARFVEQLGLHPVILHEQTSAGKTIIEKIEHYSTVGFGIVLYTACDIGGKNAEVLKSRARQNVVFEHGLLIGKIGRSKVCALVKGDIETPNDISGVVYVKMDEANAWQFQVAKELKSSGYHIDMNRL